MSHDSHRAPEVTPSAVSPGDARTGILFAILCYLFWGMLPLFWKLLDDVGAVEIVFHRMFWAFVFMAVVATVKRIPVLGLLRDRRVLAYLVPASIIVSFNWGLYIYAVITDHVVEASLGYYINPLFTILLGVIVLHERLTRVQLISTILAAIGVAYLALDYGQVPWISLGLAMSFGVYGLIKKKAGYHAVQSLTVETSLMALPALIGIMVLAVMGTGSFLSTPLDGASLGTTGLLMASGVVTAVPLLLFAHAANLAPLTLIGFVQYFSPTVSLILGVVVFGEPFTTAHVVCFSFIWAGIILTAAEAFLIARAHRAHRSPRS